MRQRMGATEASVQSIKDLCSQQQQLGVIGDEVQLSGAQQIATFLTQESTLSCEIIWNNAEYFINPLKPRTPCKLSLQGI